MLPLESDGAASGAIKPYLVLARKYRPQRFADLKGQEHVVRVLQNAMRTGRLHHAYLLTGTRGVGKTTSARILAKAFNCRSLQDYEPCCVCGSCVEIARGMSPDVMEIDAASHTGVDDVRILQDTIQSRPMSGRFRVVVVDEVHMLSNAAFNAFLKTLEEPPPHVKFIFATTDADKLPRTILSRCQRFDFRQVPVGTLMAHLKDVLEREGIGYDGEATLLEIARAARGSIRDSLSLLEQVVAYAEGTLRIQDVREVLGGVDRAALVGIAKSLLNSDTASALDHLKRALDQGVQLRPFVTALLEHLRDVAVMAAVLTPGRGVAKAEGDDPMLGVCPDLTPDEKAEVITQAKAAPLDTHVRRFHILAESADDIARSSGQGHLLLELALVRMAEVRPVVPVDHLIEGVRKLLGPGGLASGGGGRGPFPAPGPGIPGTPAARPTDSSAGSPRLPPVAASIGHESRQPLPSGAPRSQAPTSSPASGTASSPSSAPLWQWSGDTFSLQENLIAAIAPHASDLAVVLRHLSARRFDAEILELVRPSTPGPPLPEGMGERIEALLATLVNGPPPQVIVRQARPDETDLPPTPAARQHQRDSERAAAEKQAEQEDLQRLRSHSSMYAQLTRMFGAPGARVTIRRIEPMVVSMGAPTDEETIDGGAGEPAV